MAKKAKNKKLYKNAIVEKRNILNEVRKNNMSLQELRFFSIYLSKINARDINTRLVQFPLVEFQKIMGFQDLNVIQIKASFTKLLQQVVTVPNENGPGFTSFQLFKRCKLFQNEFNEWIVEINASDDALPLMFDFKSRYFKYELWNALRLRSTNQIRMYEILKQFENIGKRELPVQELKDLLGIMPDEYSGRTGWTDFKKKVLDSCQQALKENTDICYTYEKGKSGVGGKWLTIVFHIFKNDDYIDQLTLDEFIDMQPEPKALPAPSEPPEQPSEPIDWDTVYGSEDLAILAEACEYEFDKEQIEKIFYILTRINIPRDRNTNSLTWGRHHYLCEKYAALNIMAAKKRANGEKINDRFAYFVSMLEDDTYQPAAYRNED